MKKQILIILILTITIILSSFYVTTSTAFPDNPGTQAYFNKICRVPYVIHLTKEPMPTSYFWKHGGDCDDRALAFKEYLESKGATNYQMCWVARIENGEAIQTYGNKGKGHVFIVWDNKVYSPDPINKNYWYGEDIKVYQNYLKKKYGFNTWYSENQTIGTPF